jgi:cation diffusion facilitator family transporter
MHNQTLQQWQHDHDFSIQNKQGEQRTFYVLILTAITMVVEVIAGTYYGSMALLADGWHMGTHVAAFLIAIFAYRYARNYANSPKYTFGTGKVNTLGGFASAIALTIVALMMAIESIFRFFEPHTIAYNESILVAIIGLVVNVASMLILKDHHHHGHGDHDHHHHDHNLKAAYLHVLTDAMTSLFAIVALLLGKYYGLGFMDPLMGIVGAVIITRWSLRLVKESAPILLDESIEPAYLEEVKSVIEKDKDNKISDIHIWKIGANDYAVILSLITHEPQPSQYYRDLLQPFKKLSHITVEVHPCEDDDCLIT